MVSLDGGGGQPLQGAQRHATHLGEAPSAPSKVRLAMCPTPSPGLSQSPPPAYPMVYADCE